MLKFLQQLHLVLLIPTFDQDKELLGRRLDGVFQGFSSGRFALR
jgi:hypothetical protein